MSAPAIQLKSLAIGYPQKNVVVLENLNLGLQKGKLICLLGVNGSGKSTLIRTLAGFQPALDGQVLIEGKPMDQMGRSEVAKNISVVLTDRIGTGQMTARELIALGRYPFTNWLVQMTKEDGLAIQRAIEATGTINYVDRPLSELSDGQLQKCLIARSLAQDGPIMILDEPTTHLDLNNRVSIMRLLRQLAIDENKLVLIATHELDLALQMADGFLLINDGKIEEGLPEDLVLSGTLDKAFELKGFDLKTGRAFFEPTKSQEIALIGEGYSYLWTKNALERNGYRIAPSSNVQVSIQEIDPHRFEWVLSGNERYKSLEQLLTSLEKNVE